MVNISRLHMNQWFLMVVFQIHFNGMKTSSVHSQLLVSKDRSMTNSDTNIVASNETVPW